MPRHDRPQSPVNDELTLFDTAPQLVRVAAAETIQDTFEAFHKANPWVYVALVRLARDLHRRGYTRIGIGMLFEVLRWHYFRATRDEHSDFKLNNNYRSRYSRLIMDREPDLADAFEIRRLTAA
jgi:hypothetical protein